VAKTIKTTVKVPAVWKGLVGVDFKNPKTFSGEALLCKQPPALDDLQAYCDDTRTLTASLADGNLLVLQLFSDMRFYWFSFKIWKADPHWRMIYNSATFRKFPEVLKVGVGETNYEIRLAFTKQWNKPNTPTTLTVERTYDDVSEDQTTPSWLQSYEFPSREEAAAARREMELWFDTYIDSSTRYLWSAWLEAKPIPVTSCDRIKSDIDAFLKEIGEKEEEESE